MGILIGQGPDNNNDDSNHNDDINGSEHKSFEFLVKMPASVMNKQVYDDDDEKFFMQTLRDFMRKNNQPLGKLPALGFKKGMNLVFVMLNC